MPKSLGGSQDLRCGSVEGRGCVECGHDEPERVIATQNNRNATPRGPELLPPRKSMLAGGLYALEGKGCDHLRAELIELFVRHHWAARRSTSWRRLGPSSHL